MDYDFKVKEFGGKPEPSQDTEDGFSFLNFMTPSGRSLKWILIVIVALVGLGIYAFMSGRASFQERRVVLNVESPETVVSGDEVRYRFTVTNDNKASLQNAELIIFYPDESLVFIDDGLQPDQLVEEIMLENIRGGETRVIEKRVLLVGTPGDVKAARFKLTYAPEGVSTVFEKEVRAATTVSQVPVSLNLFAPPNVLSGQTADILFDYRNETDDTLSDLRIKITYPDGLKLLNINPIPTQGSGIWDIPALKSGRGDRISVSALYRGREGETKTVVAVLQKKINGEYFDFGRVEVQSVINSPFLSAEIDLRGKDAATVSAGETLQYEITFRNNSTATFRNLTLRAKLEGELFDFASLDPRNAFFDDTNRTILWNASVEPLLGNLGPNQESAVSFNIRVKEDVPDFLKDISLRVSADIETPTVPPQFTVDRVTAHAELISRVATAVDFETRILYNDTVFANTGPNPPRVGEKTTYTIHWSIGTRTSDLVNVRIRALLFPGVTWEDQTSVNFGQSRPEYDAAANAVEWEIPQVPAGTGGSLPKYEGVFMISITPSVNQVGESVNMLRAPEFTAFDSFTQNDITINGTTVTTSAVPEGSGLVQP